jgi:hypothetical protein
MKLFDVDVADGGRRVHEMKVAQFPDEASIKAGLEALWQRYQNYADTNFREEFARYLPEGRFKPGEASQPPASWAAEPGQRTNGATGWSMEGIAPLVRRPVAVDANAEYREVGIRSYGKWHLPARPLASTSPSCFRQNSARIVVCRRRHNCRIQKFRKDAFGQSTRQQCGKFCRVE